MPILRSGEARTPTRSRLRIVAPLVLAAALGLALAGCTPEAAPSPTPTADVATPTATASAPPAAAVYDPNAGAAANKPVFDQTNQAVIAANPSAGGADFIVALRNAGFDGSAMQLTPDITTVGVKADSVQFSVRLSDGCLVGQYGLGSYESQVMPALGTGGCLIGQTRPIDF